MIRQRLLVTPPAAMPNNVDVGTMLQVNGTVGELPLPNNCVDAAVLHHTLDYEADPRAVVREMGRVMAPGGRLLICGFNPVSLWGISGLRSLRELNFVLPWRLVDWLALLGFKLEHHISYLMFRPPWQATWFDHPRLRGLRNALPRSRLPIGGAYVLVASKQALSLRPNWRVDDVGTAKLAPVVYPNLSARNRAE